MRIRPMRVRLIPLFLLCLIFAGSAVFAADVNHYRYQFKGKSAYASFQFSDASGCIWTSMYIYASEDVTRSSSFDRFSRAYLGASLHVVDRCDGWRTISSSYGEQALEPGMLAFKGNLGGATIAAEVALEDRVTSAIQNVEIKLTWTGIGEAWTGRTHETSQGGGYRYTSRYVGSSRDAEANGTVLLDGVTLPAGTAYASLSNSRSGFFEVLRQD